MSPEYLIVRTATDPLGLAGPVRTTVRTLSPNQPITEVRTMAEAVAGSIVQRRTLMLLLGCLAAIALVLAAAGIYGAISYSVSRRTHEIGLRMALGSQRGDVLKLIIGQGMGLAAIGVALGVAGAAALTRFISTYLYGVTTTDPLTFAGVSVLLALVAVVASFIPARRAMRVDPMIALRCE
jgi:ABC-type antimicrobial peptide transport system permease subunit